MGLMINIDFSCMTWMHVLIIRIERHFEMNKCIFPNFSNAFRNSNEIPMKILYHKYYDKYDFNHLKVFPCKRQILLRSIFCILDDLVYRSVPTVIYDMSCNIMIWLWLWLVLAHMIWYDEVPGHIGYGIMFPQWWMKYIQYYDLWYFLKIWFYIYDTLDIEICFRMKLYDLMICMSNEMK